MPATIFAGSKVKTLKNTLSLNGAADIASVSSAPTSGAGLAAAIGSLALDSSSGNVYRKIGSGDTDWQAVGSGTGGINYIANPDAEASTTGWTTYKETDPCSFQTTANTVTQNGHGLWAGTEVTFLTISVANGLTVNARYYVINPTTNTFQVATTKGGSAVTITANSTGTYAFSWPRFGTGGIPNITWSRSTTNPLRGMADFNIVKDAVNRIGEGVSYAFTVDPADLAKVLTVTFDYEVVSGTFANEDLEIFLVQDPGGTNTLIQPAGYIIQAGTVGTKMKAIATFQTSSSVQNYRLCLHVSSGSASTYTLAIDNVSVGPQTVQYGAPVTDWQNYTPTGSWTTNTAYVGRWRRDGDTMELDLVATLTGAPNATGFTINLPSGYSIDTTKLSSTDGNKTLGYSSLLCAAGYYQANVRYNTTTSVGVSAIIGGSANNHNLIDVDNIRPATFASGDRVYLRVKVPISGWSSTVQMSNDTDTRVVAMQAKKTATQAVTANVTNITTNTTNLDTHGAYDGTTYTVPVAGNYYVNCTFADNASNSYIFNAYVNTVLQGQVGSSAAGYATGGGMLLPNLKAGDAITIRAGATQTVAAGGNLSIQRLSGPSAIAASETVAARYTTSTAQAISTTTIVNFTTKVFDSHNAVTTGASWKFTAPVAGKYLISAAFFTASTALNQRFIYEVFKNGTTQNIWVANMEKETTNTSRLVGHGTAVVDAFAGDTIDVRGTASGATTALSGDAYQNYIEIYRIGN